MSSGALRLFVAASVPDDHLAWVAERITRRRQRWPEARWTGRDNQHVTLKFLGSTPQERLEEVSSACRQTAAGHSPGPLALGELGVFPSLKRARVLWVGLEDPEHLLARLASTLSDLLAPLGFEPEKRSYAPHLTVARFRTPTAVGKLPLVAPPPEAFLLRSFELWRSHLSPQGARYECLESFPLGI